MLRSLSILAAAAVLAGCAVTDISTLDTAESLNGGKARTVYGLGSGMNLNAVNVNPHPYEVEPSYIYKTPATPGFNLAVGLGWGTEANFRFNFVPNSVGARLGLKKELWGDPGGWSLALAPAVAASGHWLDSGAFKYAELDLPDEYTAKTLELQMIATKRLTPSAAVSLALRGNADYHFAEETRWIRHGGLRGNVKLSSASGAFTIWEAGLEAYRHMGKALKFHPLVMFGLGFESPSLSQ
jgi:hypothetical protein